MKKIFNNFATLVVALAIISLIASIGRLLPMGTTAAAIVAGVCVLILGLFFFYGKRK